jgi:poly(3-hydroxybutyrate) depolymerase
MTKPFRALVVIAVLCFGVAAAGGCGPQTGRRVGWPCAGCITYVPPTYNASRPSTVIVALHGDEGDPSFIESVWEPVAKANNAMLIAPTCPASLGCSGSWWGWLQSGSKYNDAWIGAQVATVARSYHLDRAREFLTGWSGGADFMGWYALAHASQFRAAGFVVGGVPYHPTCPTAKQSAYFLMGTNDYRYLSGQPSQVKSIYSGCGDSTTLVVVPGADHQGTVDALTTDGYAAKMMSYFVAQSKA